MDDGIKIYLIILRSDRKGGGGVGGFERAWKEAMVEEFAAADEARPYLESAASEALPTALALPRSAPAAVAAAAAASVAAAAC